MSQRTKVAVCSEINTIHMNTLCGQNVEFLNVRPSGTSSNQQVNKTMNTISLTSIIHVNCSTTANKTAFTDLIC